MKFVETCFTDQQVAIFVNVQGELEEHACSLSAAVFYMFPLGQVCVVQIFHILTDC